LDKKYIHSHKRIKLFGFHQKGHFTPLIFD